MNNVENIEVLPKEMVKQEYDFKKESRLEYIGKIMVG